MARHTNVIHMVMASVTVHINEFTLERNSTNVLCVGRTSIVVLIFKLIGESTVETNPTDVLYVVRASVRHHCFKFISKSTVEKNPTNMLWERLHVELISSCLSEDPHRRETL